MIPHRYTVMHSSSENLGRKLLLWRCVVLSIVLWLSLTVQYSATSCKSRFMITFSAILRCFSLHFCKLLIYIDRTPSWFGTYITEMPLSLWISATRKSRSYCLCNHKNWNNGKRIVAVPSTKRFPQITECPLTENALVLSSLSDLSMSDKIPDSMEPAKDVSGSPEMRKMLKNLKHRPILPRLR